MNSTKMLTTMPFLVATNMLMSVALAQPFELSWHTTGGGGGTSAGGTFSVTGTIGQPDAGPGAPGMMGGQLGVAGGFWPGAAEGVPAATLTAAVSRKPNAAGPGGVCDLALIPGGQSEPRQGGITELRLTFDTAPGGPGSNPVTIEQAACAAPAYVPYAGASTSSASVAGNTLVLNFMPALENARTYKLTMGSSVTSIAGQFVEISGLLGDVNGDGFTNATDRSFVVGAWTGGGFSCSTDLNMSGGTNATDRSIVVGAWTGGANCAP